MATPPLSQAKMLEALQAYEQVGTYYGAARLIGIPRETLRHRITKAKEAGVNLSDGIRNAIAAAKVTPGEARHGWSKVEDEDGNNHSVFWKTPEIPPEDYAKAIIDAMQAMPPAPRISPPAKVSENTVNLYAIADWHRGATISQDEAGHEYSPDIADQRLRDGMSKAMGFLPPAKTGIILFNGDTTHANDDKDATPRSGNRLKVAGSHHSNLTGALNMSIWSIDMMLQIHDEVIVSLKKGNHDPNTPSWLITALEQRYRDEPRIKFDCPENVWFSFQRGEVFICAHHGHGVKPADLAQTAMYKFRRQIGEASKLTMYTAHRHHSKSDTFGGMLWRQLPALCLMDQHGTEEGYTDTSAMYAASFDTLTGRRTETEIQV